MKYLKVRAQSCASIERRAQGRDCERLTLSVPITSNRAILRRPVGTGA